MTLFKILTQILYFRENKRTAGSVEHYAGIFGIWKVYSPKVGSICDLYCENNLVL